MRLAGRHAVVTGGGTGIGAAVARALAAEGARLTLVGRRLETLEETAHSIRSSRANDVFTCTGDVTDPTQVAAGFAAAREAQGPVSILVNNAGAAVSAPFAKVTPAQWRETMAINLDALFHCCQAALPDLLAADAGRIVTIASMAGLHGFAYAAPYIAAKHGAVGLMRALAAEYASTRLTANAVCPGFVDSDMTVRSVAAITAKTGRTAEAARAELARLNPSGRLIAPEEVAAAVLDLLVSGRNGVAEEIA